MPMKRVTVGGAPEGYDAKLILRELEKGPVIHVARDDKRLEATRAALSFFDPSAAVIATTTKKMPLNSSGIELAMASSVAPRTEPGIRNCSPNH